MSAPKSAGDLPAEHATPQHRVHVVDTAGSPGAQVALPHAFSSALRPDLVRRAVVAAQANRHQPHGTSPTAGLRHSVQWSGKGKGVARTPRLMDSMRGAQAPNTVGGRLTHPPTVETIWAKKINVKERRLAFAAALAATRDTALVRARGHQIPDGIHLPVVLATPAEEIETSAAARALLGTLKLWDDIQRASDGVHVRAGRGKRRGRLRHGPRSLLLVTSAPGKARGFRNLSGVDVVPVTRLGTEDLAPGGDSGRLTIFSVAALEGLRDRLEGATP
jgi:large subunit ribosomal protein L4e